MSKHSSVRATLSPGRNSPSIQSTRNVKRSKSKSNEDNPFINELIQEIKKLRQISRKNDDDEQQERSVENVISFFIETNTRSISSYKQKVFSQFTKLMEDLEIDTFPISPTKVAIYLFSSLQSSSALNEIMQEAEAACPLKSYETLFKEFDSLKDARASSKDSWREAIDIDDDLIMVRKIQSELEGKLRSSSASIPIHSLIDDSVLKSPTSSNEKKRVKALKLLKKSGKLSSEFVQESGSQESAFEEDELEEGQLKEEKVIKKRRIIESEPEELDLVNDDDLWGPDSDQKDESSQIKPMEDDSGFIEPGSQASVMMQEAHSLVHQFKLNWNEGIQEISGLLKELGELRKLE